MKKQYWLSIYLILSISVKNKSNAQFVVTAGNVDPIVDLRAPRSLFEALHAGINDIYVSLQSGLEDNAELLSIAQGVENDLNGLSDMYDSMINTTRAHQVYHDDKEFLQKMIDRITSMIDSLENNGNEEIEEEVQSALRSVKNVCDSFKAKI